MYIRLFGRFTLRLLSTDDLLLPPPPVVTGFEASAGVSMLMLPKLFEERFEWQE
jgi:hypothetical protein